MDTSHPSGVLRVTQELWQDVFGLLASGTAVVSGIAVLRSATRARARPRGGGQRDTPMEVLVVCVGFLLMSLAFFIGATKAFVWRHRTVVRNRARRWGFQSDAR